MINIDQICSVLTPDRLALAVRVLNLPADLANEITLVRQALCGDSTAAARIEKMAARTPGCGCQGCAVGALKGAIAACGTPRIPNVQFPAAGPMGLWIEGGQAGFRGPGTRLATPPTDWQCRTSLGDVSGCELRKIAQDKYPSYESRLDALEDADPSLPPAPAGYAWHRFNVPAIPVSRTLCLESVVIYDLAGEPIVPARLGIRGEELACENGETYHAYGNPELPPKKGWEITDGRCRCLAPPCVCLPAGARSQFLALLPQLAVGYYGLSIELAADNFARVVCEPCEPGPLCGRPTIPRCVCPSLFPNRPTPEPPGGAAPFNGTFAEDDGT